ASCSSAEWSHQPVALRPNVILIVADDLGYGDLGSYGQKLIQTPHLDRMAEQGMRFTDFYAGSPVCAPSRCTLMTGLHPGHAYVRDNWEAGGWGEHDAEGQKPLPTGTQTLGRVLQEAGYQTACIGKWGLGGEGTTGGPLDQGFDRFFGYNCQRHAHNFYPRYLVDDRGIRILEGNDRGLTGKQYAPDLYADEALKFIREHKDGPFFVYYPTIVPHLALQVPEDSLAPYVGEWDDPPYDGKKGYLPHATPRAAYAGMVSRMDRDIGRLLAQLEEMGVDKNTLVMFTSDNGATYDIGGAHSEFFESNGVLRGAKGSVYEGGLRVPLIARWPGKIPAGTETAALGAFWDFMPTIAGFAGATTEGPLDGTTLAPALFGIAADTGRTLYWEFPGYGNQQALRQGDWMLIRRFLGDSKKTSTELYNLATDISQEHNVAAEHPELVAQLLDRMAAEHVPSKEFPLRGVDTPAK
ncbi:MAG: arylsulfatase, partial [Planctomycetes bacterium]|nr:arylsulfatase [Planctomycetota bacterium]